jgi:endoglucanase
MEVKALLEKISGVVSLTGYEYMAEPDLRKIIDEDFKGVFDEVYFDKAGSCRLVKKGVKKIGGTKKIMLDAHLDQIGLVVTEILDGGFLRVKSLGGVDRNVIIASEFYVYTYEPENPFIFTRERRIPAIAISVPPHLKKMPGNQLPDMQDIYLDTGYDSREALEKIVRVGSPVSFKNQFVSLENNLVSDAGLDDRVCAAVIMLAVKELKKMPEVDVHVVLSSSEEKGGLGAEIAAFEIDPDFAVVLDVGFAQGPDIDASGAFEMGKGAGIDYSAATSMKLTKKVIALAKEKKIPFQNIVSPSAIGTNADEIAITGSGVPCVSVSAPLKNMHMPTEIACIQDIEDAVKLITAIIENAESLA